MRSSLVPTDGLTTAQHEGLRRDGYLLLPDVLDPAALQAMRDAIATLAATEGAASACHELSPWRRRWPGARRLAGLQGRAIRLAERLLPRWPAFKAQLQAQVARPRFQGWMAALRHELWFVLHTAAMKETGALRIANLLNKSPAFDVCLRQPYVLAGVRAVLGPRLSLSSLNYRAALPGGGAQPLHADWHQDEPPGRFCACNTLWLLDDVHLDNGPTRVVPGSHLDGRLPRGPREALLQDHPAQQAVVGRAGSVLVLNSHTWHGGTLNRDSRPRGPLQAYFVVPGSPLQLDQADWLTEPARQRLGPAERALLGVD